MNWQPIDTAPVDRTDLLLWTPSGELVGHTYDRRKWYASGVKASHFECDVGLYEAPTHWMPLPAPPHGVQAISADEVRAEVLRTLLDWERHYMDMARGGDCSGKSDARADAAREIHDHLRSSWEARAKETTR